MVTRTDPEKHKDQVRRANQARYRAVRRLVAEYQWRFDELYAEETEGSGVTPAGTRNR